MAPSLACEGGEDRLGCESESLEDEAEDVVVHVVHGASFAHEHGTLASIGIVFELLLESKCALCTHDPNIYIPRYIL
jgi:hypothetical protein